MSTGTSTPEVPATLTTIHPSESQSFQELHISKSPLSGYTIENSTTTTQFKAETALYSKGKADITLHAGRDSKGKVVGDVDLRNFGGHYSIQLKDPNNGNGAVALEELDRVKGYASRHAFHFSFGGKERQEFVWRHPGQSLADNRDDLELVLDPGFDEEEVLMAQYLKGHGWKGKTILRVREGGGEKWELMVVLTLLALLVSKNREQ
jgi:hypothetical protein